MTYIHDDFFPIEVDSNETNKPVLIKNKYRKYRRSIPFMTNSNKAMGIFSCYLSNKSGVNSLTS